MNGLTKFSFSFSSNNKTGLLESIVET